MADQREQIPATNPPQSTIQILGEFPENSSVSQEYLLLMFSPSSLPLKKRWRTNGLSADFLADYLITFFPGEEDTSATMTKQAEIQSAVSYIANELLENAMKFSNPRSTQPISINLQLYPDKLIFLVANSISTAGMQKYQSFIQQALSSDPSEMLLQRLEQNLEDVACQSSDSQASDSQASDSQASDFQTSGLGLITIMSDYLAKLAWKFESACGDLENVTVTTAVQLTI